MTDLPDDGLTPIQRALAMKTQALAAKAKPPKGKYQGDRAAAHQSASKSKPWMKA